MTRNKHNFVILTVRQPWASLIVRGAKTIENRMWSTNHRGYLGIHAGGARPTPADMFEAEDILHRLRFPKFRIEQLLADLPRGALVGRVLLEDVKEDVRSPWAIREHKHWVLSQAIQFQKPKPMKGQLGLFRR